MVSATAQLSALGKAWALRLQLWQASGRMVPGTPVDATAGTSREPQGPRLRVRHPKVYIEKKRRVNIGRTKFPPKSKGVPCPRNMAFLKSYLEWALTWISLFYWTGGCVRIIGGDTVVPHSRPYMALLRGKSICAGTLIAKDWVLTAAHCKL